MNAHTQKNGTPAKLKSLWQLENQRGWAKDNQQTPKVRRVAPAELPSMSHMEYK
jgi:hypothetical protein